MCIPLIILTVTGILSLTGLFILLTIDFVRDYHKRKVNKMFQAIEIEKRVFELWQDVEDIKDELKKRGINDVK